jgi:hypothetical protein
MAGLDEAPAVPASASAKKGERGTESVDAGSKQFK